MEQAADTLEETSTIETTSLETPLTLQEQLEELVKKRSGDFELLISYRDLKYIKNALTQKVECVGPNEAYLFILTQLAIDSSLEEMDPKSEQARVKTSLPSTAIETINYFLSKVTGKGIDSAQKLFSAFMQIRPVMETMKKMDDSIKALKQEIDIHHK
jgi:hypothetical protein